MAGNRLFIEILIIQLILKRVLKILMHRHHKQNGNTTTLQL